MRTVSGKVVVLGMQGVGKTSTINRYVQNVFSDNEPATIGGAFYNCKINVIEKDAVVKLQIWDTAGQEQFKSMAPMFYRKANAAVLIFDITSAPSFEVMKDWVLELKRNVEESMVLVVIGNKVDLSDRRQVARDDALKYSKEVGATYYECSAMVDQGIGTVFENLALGLLRLSKADAPSLNIYETDISGILASSSELEPTDVGNEEVVNLSISSIAHGNSVKSNCC